MRLYKSIQSKSNKHLYVLYCNCLYVVMVSSNLSPIKLFL